MKFFSKSCLLIGLLLELAPTGFSSSIWNEVNAGGLPKSADVTSGLGPLTGIIGKLSDATAGADMYEIQIIDPAAFSATTIGNGNNPIVDPALYLFDSSGNALFGNDNTSGVNTQAQIPVGITNLLAPGWYYLLIAPSGHLPEDKNNVSLFGAITGTTGVATGSGVIKTYGGTPNGDDSGKGYEILLTGAGFAVPEPATMAFTGLGILALALGARRRSAKQELNK